MRKGWTYRKLGEITEYPNRRLKIDQLGPNSFVGVEQLIKDRGGVMFSDAAPTAESAIAYQCNDILIGNIRPYLRKIWLADRSGGASGDIVIIRIREDYTQILDAQYLYKALSSEQFFDFDNANTKGAKMPRGDRAAIAKYPIPVPPLSEQKRIVAELDLLQGIIDKQKAQLKELDTLAQSIFYDMFGDPVENEKGWEVKRLGDVCLIERGGSPRPIDDYLTEDESGINWIKIGDASDGGMVITATKQRIRPEGMKKSRFVHKGDFLLSNSMSFGKPYILGVDGCIHDGWLVIQDTHHTFNKIYLYYFLGSPQTYEAFKSMAVGGVVNNLNKDIVKKIHVAIPNADIQQSFATKVKAIERQKASINASIAETQKLFDYTMDKYFG